MREIKLHHDGLGLNDSITIEADEPGAGNTSHEYTLHIDGEVCASIRFQRGPRNEDGSVPGVTSAAILAVMIDHFRGFQSGPYACRENALVLTKLEEALHWVRARAEERAQRGVLGTHQK